MSETRDSCGHARSELFVHVEAALKRAADKGWWTHNDVARLCAEVRDDLTRELEALRTQVLDSEKGGSLRYDAGLEDGYAVAQMALTASRLTGVVVEGDTTTELVRQEETT